MQEVIKSENLAEVRLHDAWILSLAAGQLDQSWAPNFMCKQIAMGRVKDVKLRAILSKKLCTVPTCLIYTCAVDSGARCVPSEQPPRTISDAAARGGSKRQRH